MALVLGCGGGPSGEPYGFKFWHNPGPTKEYPVDGGGNGIGRLRAFFAVITFPVLAFAFASELRVVTGGEMLNPRRNLPMAGRTYFYRLIFFYVFGIFFISLIISSNNKSHLNGESGAGSSPWAVAAHEAGNASASSSLLAYLNVTDSAATVFSCFVNLINTGGYSKLDLRLHRRPPLPKSHLLPENHRPPVPIPFTALLGLRLLRSSQYVDAIVRI
ncbi:MAG: hypothetical protein Q9199_004907 [Rusavskia elegans]